MLLPCRVVRRIEIAHFSDRHFWNGGYDKAIKAEEAAAAIGGKALFPVFPDGVKGTDWNDLAKAVGRETAQIWLQCAVRVADRQTEAAKSAATAIERTPGKQAARETAELER